MNTIFTARTHQPVTPPRQRTLAIFAAVTALVSLSVHGFWRGIVPGDASWLAGTQLALLAVLLGHAFLAAQPLRGFVLLNLTLHASNWALFGQLAASEWWVAQFGSSSPLMWRIAGEQALKLVQMLVVIGVLQVLGTRRHDMYLIKGQTNAPVEPVSWLGIRGGATWARFGPIVALIGCSIFAATLIPALLATPSGALLGLLPLFPAVLLFAASNALYEEVVFKAAPLSQLTAAVGGRLALVLVATMFGLNHYTERYFLPGTSVIFPALLGYLLGKSMLETRGITWAWRVHFMMDVLVLSSLALTST